MSLQVSCGTKANDGVEQDFQNVQDFTIVSERGWMVLHPTSSVSWPLPGTLGPSVKLSCK